MINWFDMPAEGLSNGGLFEIKELTATENKVYQKDGEVYNKVTVNVPSPTGKITITENGTDIDIAQYATADVNVEGGGGSSDFSTAEVTIVNSANMNLAVMIPVLNEASLPFEPNASIRGALTLMANETSILNVPLYKGHCTISKGTSGDRIDGQTVATSYTITSGSATSSAGGVDITGDCTITISAGE